MSSTNEQELLDAITGCLGGAQAEYATNKHRGGDNGRKGSRYEDFFMAMKVATVAANQVENPSDEWPHIEGQCLGFVDDVVLSSSNATEFYQCKNSDSVTWCGGKHPIAVDFAMQKKLADYMHRVNPTTGLVVSSSVTKDALAANVPADIATHTDVHLFPYADGSMNRLIMENEYIQDTLRPLSKIEDPQLDDLVGVFAALLMSCTEHQGGCSVDMILQFANSINPAQLRTFPATVDWSKALDQAFVDVLANIEGLRYGVARGFFQWSALGMFGVFDVDCEDEKFKAFQRDVIQHKPATFEELEKFLP